MGMFVYDDRRQFCKLGENMTPEQKWASTVAAVSGTRSIRQDRKPAWTMCQSSYATSVDISQSYYIYLKAIATVPKKI